MKYWNPYLETLSPRALPRYMLKSKRFKDLREGEEGERGREQKEPKDLF